MMSEEWREGAFPFADQGERRFFQCFLGGNQGRHEIADSASERDDALCKVLSELDIQKYLLSLPCCYV